MGNILITLGIILVIVGILVLVAGTFLQITNKPDEKGKVEGGAVIMIGPIPIGFGTSKEMMILAIILAIILMILAFLFIFSFKHF